MENVHFDWFYVRETTRCASAALLPGANWNEIWSRAAHDNDNDNDNNDNDNANNNNKSSNSNNNKNNDDDDDDDDDEDDENNNDNDDDNNDNYNDNNAAPLLRVLEPMFILRKFLRSSSLSPAIC